MYTGRVLNHLETHMHHRRTPDVCCYCKVSTDLRPRKTSRCGKVCKQCDLQNRKTKTWPSLKRSAQKSTDRIRFKQTGCTPEMYDKKYTEQEGCCKICKRHRDEFKASLAADHCHKTGKIRGLLCASCNRALGLFRDNTESLMEAIKYLSHSQEI